MRPIYQSSKNSIANFSTVCGKIYIFKKVKTVEIFLHKVISEWKKCFAGMHRKFRTKLMCEKITALGKRQVLHRYCIKIKNNYACVVVGECSVVVHTNSLTVLYAHLN